MPGPWPLTPEELVAQQLELARLQPEPWRFSGTLRSVAACFVCFPRGRTGKGAAGDPGWAAAVLMRDGRLLSTATVRGKAAWPYEPGLLALREGPLLEAAVRRLPRLPDVLLVNATGRDHPRRAGLALHLGAVLGVPSVGITHRPLLASGNWPPARRGARSPLAIGEELVGYWVRTRADARPLAVHAAWRTDPETAVEVVLAAANAGRTPLPLTEARRAAREARARAG